MKDYAIIFNPTAGKKKKTEKDIELMRNCLDELNVSYKMFESEFAGHTIELASQLAKDGYRVIGAGGDGTCNEVLHGIIISNTGALCGFIPMGTGNDIPGAIGIKPDIKRACEIVAEGHSSKSDVGLAITDNGVERYFLGIGSQGFDAEVTKRTNEAVKQVRGSKNYVIQVLNLLDEWVSKEVKVIMDNDIYEGMANCLAVGNGPSYGGWMYICQKARVDDGIFDISVVDIDNDKLVSDFTKMYNATLLPHPNVHTYKSKKVRVEMKDPNDSDPYLCQVDGEVLGPLPVNYECIKDGYEFIRPEKDEVLEDFIEKHGRDFHECQEG
jgi:diacylglycerol kinase (ATP)